MVPPLPPLTSSPLLLFASPTKHALAVAGLCSTLGELFEANDFETSGNPAASPWLIWEKAGEECMYLLPLPLESEELSGDIQTGPPFLVGDCC